MRRRLATAVLLLQCLVFPGLVTADSESYARTGTITQVGNPEGGTTLAGNGSPALPTFEEIETLNRLEPFTEEWMHVSASIENRLRYSTANMQRLIETGTPRDLLVAASQEAGDSELQNDLFRLALEADRNDPLILASAIIHCFICEQEDNAVPPFCHGKQVLMQSFAIADPENALPWYQMAVIEHQRGNVDAAADYLRQGNALEKYESYVLPLFNESRATSQKLGYGDYLANYFAFGNMVNNVQFSYFKDMCGGKSVEGLSGDFLKECFLLGQKMEDRSSTIIEKLLGVLVQRNVYELVYGGSGEEGLNAIEGKKQNLLKMTQIEVENKKIGESQWVEFYNDFAKYGEIQAVNRFNRRFGDAGPR